MFALLAYSIEPHRWKADTLGIIDTLDMLTQMPGLLPDKPRKVFKLLLMKIGWSMVMFLVCGDGPAHEIRGAAVDA